MPHTHFIQPYAHVAVLDEHNDIRAISSNAIPGTTSPPASFLGRPASDLFSPATLEAVHRARHETVATELALGADGPVDWSGRQLIPHGLDSGLLLEIEPRQIGDTDFPHETALRSINQSIIDAQTSPELLAGVCERLARYLHFDRVLVYDLQSDGSGIVTEEYNNGLFDPLKGTRYRREDFPMEAHHRYRKESVLSYAHAGDEDVHFLGDISGAEEVIRDCLGCRDIFPTLHTFTREQGIRGYLSIALWDEGELWGMIFGHARDPLYLNHQLRTFAHLVGTLTSQALAYRAFNVTHRRLLASEYIRTRIRENLASANSLVEGLQRADPSLVDLIPDTTGAAIQLDGELVTLGITPSAEDIKKLLTWARTKVGSREVFATDHLESKYDGGRSLAATAAGVMFIPLNIRCTEWIAWFRREHPEKVLFGSRKETEIADGGGRRFAATVEIRRGFSIPWTEESIETARDLQSYIRDVIMERYGQLTRINHRLQTAYEELESFSYTVSHDLRAPLRGIDGFAEILMEDYGPQISPEGKELIQVIQQNAARLNQFITDILELSRVGRVSLTVGDHSVRALVDDAVKMLQSQTERKIEVTIKEPLPPMRGDARLLTMVFRHLLSNAVKYSAGQPEPRIEVGYRRVNDFGDGEYYVSDNGIGIDEIHQERVFGMFNRLVTQEDYAGNGVGLAVTRRILTRHNGEIRIESEAGKGATFLFYTDPNLSGATKLF